MVARRKPGKKLHVPSQAIDGRDRESISPDINPLRRNQGGRDGNDHVGRRGETGQVLDANANSFSVVEIDRDHHISGRAALEKYPARYVIQLFPAYQGPTDPGRIIGILALKDGAKTRRSC